MPGHRPKSREGRTAIPAITPNWYINPSHTAHMPRDLRSWAVPDGTDGTVPCPASAPRRGRLWCVAETKPPLAATLRRIERAAGSLATSAVTRMDETLPWFRALPADQRSWVML